MTERSSFHWGFEEKERSEFNQGEIFNQPALWNACPMKCEAYFIGAKPIPPGLNL
jgi:hypothetical protein